MKKSILKFLAIFAISATLFTSCSKDDNTAAPSSSFVVVPNDLKGTISNGEVVLEASTVYKLTGALVVGSGAILTIPAGTKIEATGGTAAYIAVAQGGKININGTATSPVVLTSGLATKKPGDWGGLVICGKAPINRVTGGASTAQSEVADLSYGGTISNDNSGAIKYLRIEYAGAIYNSSKEFNGLSLFGVGSGTTINFVEAYQGSDDGFEFFGGTVNTSNLISFGNEDDQFDWTEGWNGTNTNWYGKISFGKGNRGIEADNFEFGYTFTPISNPSISNLTLIGPGSTADATIYIENSALKLRRGTKGIFSNLYLSGWISGFDVEHDETIGFVGTSLLATDVLFTDITNKTKGKNTAGVSTIVATVAVETTTATGAGNGSSAPTWASGWSVGL